MKSFLILPAHYHQRIIILSILLIVLSCISISSDYLYNIVFGTQTIDLISEQWLILHLWLPRTFVAIGVGAALGISGAIFQSLSKNNLGSPDIIGINAGASAGAITVTIIWVHALPIALGALIGALLALILILWVYHHKHHFGMDVIIAGIAINAFAFAFIQFGVTGVRQEDAYQSSIWLSGTLAQRTWLEVIYISLGVPLIGGILSLLQRPLQLIQLGEQVSLSLGIQTQSIILISLVLATTLSALAVVSAGPIAFLALVAPHISKKIFQSHSLLIWPTAIIGALLLLIADLISRSLPSHMALPVGVVTSALGGIYLCVLLFWQWKK